MRWGSVIGGTLLTLVLLVALAAGVQYYLDLPTDPEPEKEYAMAADFTVQTSDGGSFTLSQQRGKAVLVEFMWTGCSACETQLTALKNIHADYQDREFELFALSVSTSDSAQDLEDYKFDHEASWLHGLHQSQPVNDYGVQGTPTLALVDQEGHLVKKWSGVRSEDELRAAIEELM